MRFVAFQEIRLFTRLEVSNIMFNNQCCLVSEITKNENIAFVPLACVLSDNSGASYLPLPQPKEFFNPLHVI